MEGKLGMKKDHLSAIGLVLGVHTGEIKFKSKSKEKREAYKGENLEAPLQAKQVILMPFQVFIMSMKCPRSVKKQVFKVRSLTSLCEFEG